MPLDRKYSLESLIDVVMPGTMLEIGSWEGGSALIFLEEAESRKLEMKILCVDTWLGSEEHWVSQAWNKVTNSKFSFQRLNLSDGEPTALQIFKQNMKPFGDRVQILRAPSQYIREYLEAEYPSFDLSYIDGDHSREGVGIDLRTCLGFNTPIAGDDWGWKSVRMAVAIFLSSRDRTLLVAPDLTTWVLLPANSHSAIAQLVTAKWTPLGKLAVWREVFIPSWFLRKLLRRLQRLVRIK